MLIKARKTQRLWTLESTVQTWGKEEVGSREAGHRRLQSDNKGSGVLTKWFRQGEAKNREKV